MSNPLGRWLAPAIVLVLVLVAVPVLARSVPEDSVIATGPNAHLTMPAPQRPTIPSARAPAAGGAEMKTELAPIEGVDIRIAESLPPQYFVDVKYGLPSGCAKPGGYDVGRADDRIEIRVYYLMPSDPNVICTMIYGIGTHSVPLGSDFTAGRTYTVDVNGTTRTFTAQ